MRICFIFLRETYFYNYLINSVFVERVPLEIVRMFHSALA